MAAEAEPPVASMGSTTMMSLDVGGHLEVILYRLQGVRITEQAYMTHFHVGHHAHHTVHHAQAGPEDGDDGQLFAGDTMALGYGYGCFHIHFFQGQISGGLVAHQHGYFGYQLSEFLYAGVLIPEDGEFMLDKRVVENT